MKQILIIALILLAFASCKKEDETASKPIVYGSVTDVDGNNYKTIILGTQTWMAENLRTTKYRNGDLIETTKTPNENISGERDPRFQWAYNGDETKVSKYGRLYTWWAARLTTITVTNAQGTSTTIHNIAPEGWHVASDADWTTLYSYLTTSGIAHVAKSLATTTNWTTFTDMPEYTSDYVGNDLSKNNSTGFSALPCGIRDPSGSFNDLGSYSYWWSTTDYMNKQAWISVIGYNYGSPEKFGKEYSFGLSVRCVKDTN